MTREEAKLNLSETQLYIYDLLSGTLDSVFIAGADEEDITEVLSFLHDSWSDFELEEEANE